MERTYHRPRVVNVRSTEAEPAAFGCTVWRLTKCHWDPTVRPASDPATTLGAGAVRRAVSITPVPQAIAATDDDTPRVGEGAAPDGRTANPGDVAGVSTPDVANSVNRDPSPLIVHPA